MTVNTPKKIQTGTPFEFGEHLFHQKNRIGDPIL